MSLLMIQWQMMHTPSNRTHYADHIMFSDPKKVVPVMKKEERKKDKLIQTTDPIIHSDAKKVVPVIKKEEKKEDKLIQTICGRQIVSVESELPIIHSPSQMNHSIVLDNHKYGQTNNNILTIIHALDYAYDIGGAKLILRKDGYAARLLKELFFWNNDSTSKESWVETIQNKFHHRILIMGKSQLPAPSNHVYYNTSKDMYFYYTDMPIEMLKERRLSFLKTLFSNPSEEMCSGIHQLLKDDKDQKYSVIHSRLMKKQSCLRRIKNFKNTPSRYNNSGQIDGDSTCLTPPNFIKSLLRPMGMLNHTIILIEDGENVGLTKRLRADPEIGPRLKTVPSKISSVGVDMVLGVLSNVFIGTPCSTFAGNIARTREAFGFEPQTNLFWIKKKTISSQQQQFSDEIWEPVYIKDSLFSKNIMVFLGSEYLNIVANFESF